MPYPEIALQYAGELCTGDGVVTPRAMLLVRVDDHRSPSSPNRCRPPPAHREQGRAPPTQEEPQRIPNRIKHPCRLISMKDGAIDTAQLQDVRDAITTLAPQRLAQLLDTRPSLIESEAPRITSGCSARGPHPPGTVGINDLHGVVGSPTVWHQRGNPVQPTWITMLIRLKRRGADQGSTDVPCLNIEHVIRRPWNLRS
jgi:hypothetical protein